MSSLRLPPPASFSAAAVATVIGFGGTAAYDSTLNGKVLDLAMREAINRLVDGMNAGAWKPGN